MPDGEGDGAIVADPGGRRHSKEARTDACVQSSQGAAGQSCRDQPAEGTPDREATYVFDTTTQGGDQVCHDYEDVVAFSAAPAPQ